MGRGASVFAGRFAGSIAVERRKKQLRRNVRIVVCILSEKRKGAAIIDNPDRVGMSYRKDYTVNRRKCHGYVNFY